MNRKTVVLGTASPPVTCHQFSRNRVWTPPWTIAPPLMTDGTETWNLQNPNHATHLRRHLARFDEVVVYEVPTICCTWNEVAWRPLATTERALNLGKGTLDTSIASVLQRRAIPQPNWVWDPDGTTTAIPTAQVAPDQIARQAKAHLQASTVLYRAQSEDIARISSLDLNRAIREVFGRLETTYGSMTNLGIHLDKDRRRRFASCSTNHLQTLEALLLRAGIVAPESDEAVAAWLMSQGSARRAAVSFDDEDLKDLANQHRQTPHGTTLQTLRRYRRLGAILGDGWLLGKYDGPDGRIHPIHLSFAQPTGRTTTLYPTVTSLPKELRPIIVPALGHGIFEVDYTAAEIGVAAARCGDAKALELYRTGAAVAAIAQKLFPTQLGAMPLGLVKKHHRDLYDIAKIAAYGSLYGMSVERFARTIGRGKEEAQAVMATLRSSVWPGVAQCLDAWVEDAKSQRVRVGRTVPVANGLTRALPPTTPTNAYQLNTIPRNTPIQGMCAAVFRRACADAADALRPLGGRLLLPVHDSLVCSAPLDRITEARIAVRDAMVSASAMELPGGVSLFADADLDCHATSAWSKDGHIESFDRFIEDPNYRL